MIDLEKLEALAKAATPGPWFVTCNCTGKTFYTIKNDRVYIGEALGVYNGEANAAYIVAACNAVPKLIKMYRDAKDEANAANAAYQVVDRDNVDLTRHILEARVVELEQQRDKFAAYLETLCRYCDRDGHCPIFNYCPAPDLLKSCGDMKKEDWITAAEEAE